MAKRITTGHEDFHIEIGTRADDGRIGIDRLYIATPRERHRALSQTQALALAATLIETVR